jgi:hypothetical protein
MVKELLDRVVRFWAAQGVGHDVPATGEEIADWEARYGRPMPRALREWFTTVNGMGEEGGGIDDDLLISFYPLGLFRSLPEDSPALAVALDAES